MNPRQNDCEVAIAGGGPVGLCLALLLARQGIAVVLCEAEGGVSQDLRASTFHPPTLDMLGTVGVADDLLEQGLICPSWQVRLHPTGERAVFDLGALERDTPHPYRLQCEQWKLSNALLARLQKCESARVMFGSRVTGFAQDDDSVTAEILRDGAAETIRARFLIGADGARSTIRDILALPFRGETFPETTVLATTTFPFEDHLEGLSNVSYCWKDGGNFSLLKVPGRWRVSIYPREDLPIEQQITPESIEANLQEIVPSDTPYEVGEQRAYRVHQRIVHTYRIGRVALVGDAAHINSPSGGMGLNCGIHDAFELNETLTAILRTGAPLSLLDRYDRRRRPIAAEHIIAQSGNNRARMRERDLQKRTEILHGLQAITRDPQALHAYLLKSSMIAGLRAAAEID